MANLKTLVAWQVLDSRGIPTVCARATTSDGFAGEAMVPSGASTGAYEACERRDGAQAFLGQGVQQAIHGIEKRIAPEIIGMKIIDQAAIDARMCALDGTEDKSSLGANAILAVSLAVARAAAASSQMPLHTYLSQGAPCMPVPYMNVLNGGVHADNPLSILEFMIVPHGFDTFTEALQAGAEMYQTLKLLKDGCRQR